MISVSLRTLGLCALALGLPPVLCAQSLPVEDLGTPMVRRSFGLRCVTKDASGMIEAWGGFESPERFALVGVRIGTGKVTMVDINEFGPPPVRSRHPQMMTGGDGNLYAFVGSPGHFVKFDVTKRKLVDLGVPSPKATYWLGATVGPDGCFYIGTTSETELLRCDPATGKIENMGRLSDDAREHYAPHPVVSDANVIYCPVGMHHGELWAVDPRSGARKQILPATMLDKQGAPTVWRAKDGQVYGEWTGVKFRCTPEAIVPGETNPLFPRFNPKLTGDVRVGDIDEDGKMNLFRDNKESFIATEFEGAIRPIYSVSCERDGVIYGGGVAPANTFAYDPAARKFTNFGQLSSGPVQVYDTLNHERGLFLASYMNASIDFFDPRVPVKKGVNPQRVVTLPDQERPAQELLGPDGMIYSGTTPSKGRLGGALLRVNPADLTHRVWNNIVTNQSVTRLASIPATGEVLGVTSISGGSSATPTEKEAVLFLWNCRDEKVAFTAHPLPDAKGYGAVVRGNNGLVYGVESRGNRYFAFDPVARKTVMTGTLPVNTIHFPDLADEPFGPAELIYGLGDDAVFVIDPADGSAKIVGRDPALKDAFGFCVAHDGRLYFGRHGHLMRCQLPATAK